MKKPNLNISVGQEEVQVPIKVFHVVNPVNVPIDIEHEVKEKRPKQVIPQQISHELVTAMLKPISVLAVIEEVQPEKVVQLQFSAVYKPQTIPVNKELVYSESISDSSHKEAEYRATSLPDTLHFDLISKPNILLEQALPLTPRTYMTRFESTIEIHETLEKRQNSILRKPISIPAHHFEDKQYIREIVKEVQKDIKVFNCSYKPIISPSVKSPVQSVSEIESVTIFTFNALAKPNAVLDIVREVKPSTPHLSEHSISDEELPQYAEHHAKAKRELSHISAIYKPRVLLQIAYEISEKDLPITDSSVDNESVSYELQYTPAVDLTELSDSSVSDEEYEHKVKREVIV